MNTLTLPETYTTPKFQFGQTVYIEGTDNDPYTVVGMAFITRGQFTEPFWRYQLTDKPQDSILNLFRASHGHDMDESEISAEPWPIEGETCVGVQYPCDKPAAYWSVTWTGSDCETRRSVELAYCPNCWREIQRIEREAAVARQEAA